MKSFLLIGLGRFGKHLAMQLNDLGHEVMAIDKDEARVNEVLPYATNAQIGDCTDSSFLASLGLDSYDVCFVAIANDFQASLETTYLLKEMGARFVVARAERDLQVKFLLRNGADEVVYPEKHMADWAATRYSAEHILDFIQLDDNYSIYEVTIPKNWVGLSIGQIDIRRKYNISVVAVKTGGRLQLAITADMVLREDMTLLVIGDYKALQRCFRV